MAMPGVGPFVAVTIRAKVGEMRRFPNKKKLSSYAGVAPRTSNSGGHIDVDPSF